MPALTRRYDEAVARAEYMQHLRDVAATQNLSEDTRQRSLGLSIGFTVFATMIVVMRFLARRKQGAAIMLDDWLIVFCLVMLFGNLGMNISLINMGVGFHTGSLSYEQLAALNETLVGAEILYVTGVNMFKISLLFLYLRIFPTPDVRKWGRILGGISIAWNIACIFAATFQCLPREKLWKPWLQGGCIDLFLTQLCISVPVILLDMCILLLPLPHVWRLKTNLTQRIFLTIIFLLGSYVVFTSIYRFVIFLGYNNDDNSFTLGDGIAWNVIEISSGIVSACLPTLGPLVRPIFKGLTSMTSKYGRPSNGGYSKDALGGSGAHVSIGGGVIAGRVKKGGGGALPCNLSKFAGKDVLSSHTAGQMSTSITHTHGGTGNDSHASLDEIPLTAIKKETQVSWAVEELNQKGGRSI